MATRGYCTHVGISTLMFNMSFIKEVIQFPRDVVKTVLFINWLT